MTPKNPAGLSQAQSWVGGVPPPVRATNEAGEFEGVSDEAYALASVEAGETTALVHRVEAACVTLGHGAKETGYRTLYALMHPSKDLEPPGCNREAAAVIFLVIAGLLEGASPEVIERISRRINERLFETAGLL